MKQLSFLKDLKFRLKQRDLAIIIALLCVAAVAAWWQFMRQPSMERISTLNTEIEKVEKDIAIAERAKRELPALRTEIEALEEEEQERLQAETEAMASSSNWMMSPNVGMTLDADVKVRSVDGDRAILDGTLTQVTGQSVFFSMNLTRVDGAWLLAPG